MTPEIALDLMLIVLLAATVGYCVVLNARLGRLRDGQAEFKELVDTLTAATDKAQTSLKELRSLTETASLTLSKNIKSARELADELAVITESGGALAERLEGRLTGGAKGPRPVDLPAKQKQAGQAEKSAEDGPAEPPSEAEKELLTMLRNVR